MQEKVDYESKNESENFNWKKHKVITCSSIFETSVTIKALYALSNRRIAVPLCHPNCKIKIYDVDSGKHIATLSNSNSVYSIQEITKNRLVSANISKNGNSYCIKIWDLNTYKLLKKFKISLPPDIINESFKIRRIKVIYLNNEKLLVIFPKRSIYTIDLKSESNQICHSNTNIDDLHNIRQFNKDNFIAISSLFDSIHIFDTNFQLIESLKFENKTFYADIHKIEVLDDNEFILIDTEKNVFVYKQQKLREIGNILKDKIPVADLKKIILNYLGDDWECENITDNTKRFYDFTILPNNKALNLCKCGTHVQLWNLRPLTLVKEKYFSRIISFFDLASFSDGTFIIGFCNDKIKIYKPTIS